MGPPFPTMTWIEDDCTWLADNFHGRSNHEGVRMIEDRHGSLNVPIEHHPTIRYMVYNGYYKVMSNIPKMGHLPIPDRSISKKTW